MTQREQQFGKANLTPKVSNFF